MLKHCLGLFMACVVLAGAFAGTAAAQDTDAEDVYRLFNTERISHFWTIHESERDSLLQLPEWVLEGEAWEAFETQVPGTVPVYRFFNPVTGNHFYTATETERQIVLNNLPDFEDEGVVFYAYAGPIDFDDDEVPVYRFFNPISESHFYTANPAERELVLNQLPEFTPEGIVFYVEPADDQPNDPDGPLDGDFAGNWTGDLDPADDSLDRRDFTLSLTQNGEMLTGTATLEQTPCGNLGGLPVSGSVVAGVLEELSILYVCNGLDGVVTLFQGAIVFDNDGSGEFDVVGDYADSIQEDAANPMKFIRQVGAYDMDLDD
jgi:hypothetical protein